MSVDDSQSARLNLVLLGGEGIGPEVVEATATVLGHLIPNLELSRPAHGQAAIKSDGTAIPEATRDLCAQADAVLFGATQQYCHDVLRYLRWGMETFANVRPTRTRPGLPSPLKNDVPLDILVVRENLEGEYPGREGDLAELHRRWPELRDDLNRPLPTEGLFTLRLTTEVCCRQIASYARDAALDRRETMGEVAGRVTIVTKANLLTRTDGMFRSIAEEIFDAAGVEYNHFYVDDACRRLVAEPESFGVILCPNLFGDIISDITAELIGGMGMAPSGCIGHDTAYFESVHGSAPDIAGQGVANPMATVLSAAMMLDHLGRTDEAAALDAAVDRLLADGNVLTPDLGGDASTDQVVAALISSL